MEQLKTKGTKKKPYYQTVVEVKGLEFQKERKAGTAQRLQIPRKTTLGLCRKNFRWWWWWSFFFSYVTSRMNSWGSSKLGKWHFLMPPPSFFASSVVILLQQDLHNWAIFASRRRCWGGGREKTQNTTLLSFFSLFVFLRDSGVPRRMAAFFFMALLLFSRYFTVFEQRHKSLTFILHIYFFSWFGQKFKVK